jgi:hypothetical protein
MFTTSILKCLKKIYIFAKKLHLLSSTWVFFLKFPQILNLIQVIESRLRKHDYNDLAFEVHANKN